MRASPLPVSLLAAEAVYGNPLPECMSHVPTNLKQLRVRVADYKIAKEDGKGASQTAKRGHGSPARCQGMREFMWETD